MLDLAPTFELETYHQVMAAAGLAVILAYWLPRLVSSNEPTAAPVMIVLGAAGALALPALDNPFDPVGRADIWKATSELAVIIALFGAGLRIDRLGPIARWGPTLRLLLIAMPITIAAAAGLGYLLCGLTLAGALLLGAVLSPTDPVLAGDVQVGPPHKGGEDPVRFTLTTEAGLNDGLAFPFVYLGIFVATLGPDPRVWLLDWLTIEVGYRILVGVAMGWLGARLLGHVLFRLPRNAILAETGSGVLSLAGVLLCYGSTELVEGYGFIAVAVLGLTLRRIEAEHDYHRRLHDFSEALEEAMTALLLVALGTSLPVLLTHLTWRDAGFVLILLLVIRPLAGWVSLTGSGFSRPQRAVTSIYGVRGIGSIFYLSYALTQVEFHDQARLWALTALTILLSTMLHGFSVNWAMQRLERRDDPAARDPDA